MRQSHRYYCVEHEAKPQIQTVSWQRGCCFRTTDLAILAVKRFLDKCIFYVLVHCKEQIKLVWFWACAECPVSVCVSRSGGQIAAASHSGDGIAEACVCM